jgi:hypothetical protein
MTHAEKTKNKILLRCGTTFIVITSTSVSQSVVPFCIFRTTKTLVIDTPIDWVLAPANALSVLLAVFCLLSPAQTTPK